MTLFESPFLLGFEHFERKLNRLAKSGGDGYPPYNIEQIGENGIMITVAVAGFSKEDLDVTLEENQLVVGGRHLAEEKDRLYLHRGIAARQFQRSFVLADGIEVVGAELEDGMLRVELARPTVDAVVRTIDIKTVGPEEPATIETGKTAAG